MIEFKILNHLWIKVVNTPTYRSRVDVPFIDL